MNETLIKALFGDKSLAEIQKDGAQRMRDAAARTHVRTFRVTKEGSFASAELYGTLDAHGNHKKVVNSR